MHYFGSIVVISMKNTAMNKLLFSLLVFGWMTSASAQITVNDYPMQVTANIDQLDAVAGVTASSACGAVESTVVDQTFSGGCLGTLVRTYTFTDSCGNSASAQQFIKLEDTQAPVLSGVPQNTSASPNQLPAVPEVTATDNSGVEVKINYHEFKENDQVTRSWIAEDQCGNVTTAKQVIALKAL